MGGMNAQHAWLYVTTLLTAEILLTVKHTSTSLFAIISADLHIIELHNCAFPCFSFYLLIYRI